MISSSITHETTGGRSGIRPRSEIRPPSLWGINIPAHLVKLAQYKDLIATLSVHRLKVRYKQSVLGVFWAVLQPLSVMLIFTFIFSTIARMPSEGAPYALFAYTALLPWNYFSAAVSNATNSLASHAQFVTKVYFPREILPITYVVAAFFDFMVASTLLVGLMIYYRVSLTINALYAVPVMLVLTCFSLAMSFFFSATHVRFRDIGVGVPLLLQVWLFATPIIYPLSAVPPRLRPVYVLNPMVGIIESFRQVILGGRAPAIDALLISAAISVILLVVSYIYFKFVEATMADFV
ncbi:MAG: ABC transporter permease [Pyrinomonadaceae bacterium]